MTDLLDRLRSSLGASYRIERELAGGMSRVFVAEDVKLARQVVLKVLPAELAGEVNLARFEREIRLAARLQHPHIVPVLAAGAADNLPYYVMPFIEGESLRARLAREGELPLREVVRLFREILDALQYAHQHGVVHRDIKPDNVLLTGQHAVVTDFGVAKAVSDAAGEARLTSTGIALGTPAYMAPEQIGAEPNVDQRADIYAMGVLAFEMATGLPPFRGSTMQGLLSAHMTQSPPTLSSLRQGIPAALDGVVLRCLEKRPADRWQSAGEIIPQLDAIASTIPSLPASAAMPAPPTAPNAPQPGHPLRVAALFGLASVAVLALVWGIVRVLGLPDWVLQGAIALLVAGLPIMLITGRRERQRAVAGDVATPTGIERLFTWRRSIQGGVLAFAALGVATTAFMTSRALGIGPGATLLSAGVLAPRDRIVIADFDNRTTDSTLGLTVTQLLRVDLAQSPSISVMEPSQVSQVLARMQRDRATVVTPEVAQEIAVREGIKAYLSGEILPAGSGFVIAVKLVSPSSGDALVTLRQSVSTPDKLMDGVDRLSSKLREEVGESLRSVRADPPLEQVTTSSLTALRLYAEGTRAADNAGYDRAITLLEQAVEQDSGFAMAWRRLGMYSLNRGPLLRAKGDSALRRAWVLRDRLTERERLFVEAGIAYLDTDHERAAAAYASILEKDPNEPTALNNLGVEYEALGRSAEALAMFRRTIATRMAPALSYGNAVLEAADNLGRLSEADTILAEFRRDFPEASELPERTLGLASLRQDFRAVDSIAQIMIRGSAEQQLIGHLSLSMTAELAGRLHDASREYRTALRVQTRGQLSANEGAMLAELADIQRTADYASDPRPLARRLQSLWEANRTFTAQRRPIQRRHREFGPLFARLGDTARARQLMEEHTTIMTDRDYPTIGARVRGYTALATVANAAGRPNEALARIREGCGTIAGAYVTCDRLAFLEFAEAFDRAGQPDSAIAAYRRFVELRALRWFAPPGTLDIVT
ncbi:MAG: protein kinase domain-containing protein, partial [Gemmatimonadaceae bacterium]